MLRWKSLIYQMDNGDLLQYLHMVADNKVTCVGKLKITAVKSHLFHPFKICSIMRHLYAQKKQTI